MRASILLLALLLPILTVAGRAHGQAFPWVPLEILGEFVQLGEKRQINLVVSESFVGVSIPTPVLVARGTQPGPMLCVTAGIHGDEINGVEVARRAFQLIEADRLRGTFLAVPIVNIHGFRASSRYLPDRRDLNRFFPGNSNGSAASRIAHVVFHKVLRNCDALVDLHTGSFHRTNLPQLRADLRKDEVRMLAQGFRSEIVVHSEGLQGTLRRASNDAGIPAITYEAGEPMRLQDDVVQSGVRGVVGLLRALGMSGRKRANKILQSFYVNTRWVRVSEGGLLVSQARLGQHVAAGDLLGTVTDPITNELSLVRSPSGGRLIGMALNQVVIPGFAAYHLAGTPAAPNGATEEDITGSFRSELEDVVESDDRPE